MSPDADYLAFVFCATFFVYSLDRLPARYSPEDAWNRPEALAWRARLLPWLVVLTIAAGIYCLTRLFYFPAARLGWIAAMLPAALLYVIPIRGRRLDFGFCKPIIPALLWAIGLVWLPLRESDMEITRALFFTADRFLLLLANALLFDVFDFIGDRRAGRRTPAVLMGRVVTVRLVSFLCAVGILWALYVGAREGGAAVARGLPSLFLWLIAIGWARLTRGRRGAGAGAFAALLADGVLILPALIEWSTRLVFR